MNRIRLHTRIRGRRLAAIVAGFALVASQASAALGVASFLNFQRGEVTSNPPLAAVYDYTAGSIATWTSQADFAAGSNSGTTATMVPDSVVLQPQGPAGAVGPDLAVPWFDVDWTNRRCYPIDHSAAGASTVTEYQVQVPFDAAGLIAGGYLQADLGDLRAVASDGVTQLPLWVERDRASVWVRVDAIPGGGATEFCLYFGYAAGTASSLPIHTQEAVFSYSTLKPIYYAVSGRYDSTNTRVNVVTLVDGNRVQRDGGTTLNLNSAGDRGRFNNGTTSASVFSVLGPIASHGDNDGFETLVPISFAGTEFIVPTTRGTQRFSFYAPFADANVQIFNGGAAAPYAAFTVPAGTAYTHNAGDVNGSNAAIIVSDVPVLATHVNTARQDSLALYPATTRPLMGVHSRNLRVGFSVDATDLTIRRSNGTTLSYTHNRGETRVVGGGGGQGGGANDGYLTGGSAPIAAISQADGDGLESTMFLPVSELGSEYWIPDDSQYVAVACPEAGAGFPVVITPPTGAPRTINCVGPGASQPTFPGWAKDTANLNVTGARGIRVHSPGGEPFFAYYEYRSNGDETNLLGLKQGRQYTWPEPAVAIDPIEGLYRPAGTWESATLDTGAGTEVFGTLDVVPTMPPGTSLRLQVATADIDPPTVFVGPDGTPASWFTPADATRAIAFSSDGDRYVRIRAELTTTDPLVTPQLDQVDLGYHLPLLDRPVGGSGLITPTGSTTGTTTSYLLRIATTGPALAGSVAHVDFVSGSGLGTLTATVRVENAPAGIDVTQLIVAGGPPAPSSGPDVPFDAATGHSLVVDHQSSAPGSSDLELRWRLNYASTGSIFVESDSTVRITAP